MRRRQLVTGTAGAVGLVAVVLFAAVGLGVGRSATGPGGDGTTVELASPGGTAADAAVTRLQDRLDRVPGDWAAWADLGLAFVEQARATGDPAAYPRADAALVRSLELRPDGNDAALTGQAALAAGRHDFPGALRSADAAIAVNSFNATAHGVRFDALVELGRYPEAWQAAQTAVDLRPDVASLSRVAYALELRGETEQAAATLRRVAAAATSPADAGFAYLQLGELARQSGDVDGAEVAYQAGLARDPSSVALAVGVARVAASRGDTDTALAGYEAAVTRSPQPALVAEYGELLESVGRVDEAQRQYALVRATAELFRAQGVEVDVELALFEADHGDPAAALEALTPAPGEPPGRGGIFVADARAWALHQLGRDAEALAAADEALGLGTPRALFRYHRGVVHAALGDRDAAVDDLRAALATDPHFSSVHAARAQRLLSSLDAGQDAR